MPSPAQVKSQPSVTPRTRKPLLAGVNGSNHRHDHTLWLALYTGPVQSVKSTVQGKSVYAKVALQTLSLPLQVTLKQGNQETKGDDGGESRRTVKKWALMVLKHLFIFCYYEDNLIK